MQTVINWDEGKRKGAYRGAINTDDEWKWGGRTEKASPFIVSQ